MSEGDETVHHHQQVDESAAGLADDPDDEDIDGEYGGGSEGKEGVEILVEMEVDFLGGDHFQREQLCPSSDCEDLDLSHSRIEQD